MGGVRSAGFIPLLALVLFSPAAHGQTPVHDCKTFIEGQQPDENVYNEVEKPEHDYKYEKDEKCEWPEDLKSSGPIACRNIDDSLKELEKFIKAEKRGEDHARLANAQEDKDQYYEKKGPQDYRERYLKDGHLPVKDAWKRYVADSLRTLDVTQENNKQWERFLGCVEPREIEGDERYKRICQANCPPLVGEPVACGCMPCIPPPPPPPPRPGQPPPPPPPTGRCVPQKFELYSYYLPVYTIILGKDGHRFVDPTMFQPAIQSRNDLTLDSIKQHHDQHIDSDILPQLDKKGIPSDLFERPDWYDPGKRFFLESWTQEDTAPMVYAMSMGGIRTNWVARFSDSKIPGTMHHGYKRNNLCMAWAAPEETQIRKVLTNYMEAEDMLNNILLFPEFTGQIDKKKYDHVHYFEHSEPDMFKAAEEVKKGDKEELTKIGKVPRWRRWKWPGGKQLVPGWTGDECGSGFDDLELVGIEKKQEDKQAGDVIYWAFETSPFTNVEYWHNPLIQAIGNSGRAALVLGSKSPKLKHVNTDDPQQDIKRHLQFTYYKQRYEDPKVDYLNTRYQHTNDKYQCCKCPNSDQCCGREQIGLDKFQVVFPPVPPNRGNECFGLNTVPRHLNDANWPQSLLTFFIKYGLVHVTVWDYRVACACEICGLIQGCLTLDRGDFAEDSPEGDKPFPNGLPESLQVAMGSFKDMAMEEGPFGNPPLLPCECHLEFDFPGSANKGKPGPIQGQDQNYCAAGKGADAPSEVQTKRTRQPYEQPNCHQIIGGEEQQQSGG